CDAIFMRRGAVRRMGDSFKRILSPDHEIISASSGQEALLNIESHRPDLVIMDIRMPGTNGLVTLKKIKEIDARLPVIIVTAYGTMQTAIEAMGLGAYEYMLKPFDVGQMRKIIDKALAAGQLMKKTVSYPPLAGTAKEEDLIVGSSAQMQEIYKMIGQVAGKDVTVLLRGESGTGKELVARAIYQHSKRSDQPFVVVNCAAIPETLLESELFGYEKGAFTGAEEGRIGKFEQSNGGTMFLDVLCVKAILESDREAAIQAMMLDPLTAAVCSLAEVRKMATELFEAEKRYIPGYLTSNKVTCSL
ncbi:two-component system, NtrC family, nitrogen regulation response regulator GlnG, partial [Candidatus Hakubella thermalkaliphila]